MNKELEGLYEIQTPRKKEIINQVVGDFGEKNAINQYLKWLNYRDELSLYDHSRSSRAHPFTNDKMLSPKRQHFLSYDYVVVEDELLEGAVNRVYKLEVKTKLFGKNNYQFKIGLNQWKRYLEESEKNSDTLVFLFVNLNDGIVRMASINHKLFRIRPDGVYINTYLLNNIGDEFSISETKRQKVFGQISKMLGYKQQPLPGFLDEESI